MKTTQEILKEYTSELHEKAETHPLMKSFIQGNYKKTHLFQYLLNLRPLYETVEQRLIVQDIHKNFDLCRSRLVSKDISLLYREGIINDDNLDALNLKKSVCGWVANQWTVEKDYLISDFYVRWLADLYGGRIFAKTLAPYINTYQCNDVSKAITGVREIINKAEIDPNVVKYRANAFFEFHIDLFDEIYAS
jgi:heme oxygenase